ncbi:AraC family transcriptional regulator [Sporosarcina globispora]|uniref:AraC family transcriptional regulator n=1 Tax=Sporosarcina globispora TaxID=1459 RepID=UPI000A44A8C7|nr:AraC family transcriptional regulator [Sporosarcina globispora]
MNLKDVSQKAGLSTFHFHKIFKNVVGETLKQYGTMQKLKTSISHSGIKIKKCLY